MTKIEEIARAIYLGRPRNRPWAVLPKEFRRQYEKQAAAVLKAMRLATPSMIAAVALLTEQPAMEDYGIAGEAVNLLPPSEHPDVADVLAQLSHDWTAMIDHLIQEGKK